MIPLFKVWTHTEKALENLREVLSSGYVGQGPWCERFEAELARVLKVEPWQVVLVNSGTSAISLALALCGVEPTNPGGEVILNPTTCTSDPHAVLSMGGKIVWADVHPRSGLMDFDDACDRITRHTRCFLSTDWGGATPDDGKRTSHSMTAVSIPVIQDAAHGFTGRLYGEYACYSFQAIKALHTADGGCLVVRTTKEKAHEARLRRWFGLDRTSNADFRCSQQVTLPGWKWQATDVDAAIGLANLEGALESVAANRRHARFYHANLPEKVLVPWDDESPWWIYTILVSDRDKFKRFMEERGITTSPVHARTDKHEVFGGLREDLKGVNEFCSRNIAIPCGFWVTDHDRERIVKAAWEWVGR